MHIRYLNSKSVRASASSISFLTSPNNSFVEAQIKSGFIILKGAPLVWVMKPPASVSIIAPAAISHGCRSST